MTLFPGQILTAHTARAPRGGYIGFVIACKPGRPQGIKVWWHVCSVRSTALRLAKAKAKELAA